jgi:hypothetical protein
VSTNSRQNQTDTVSFHRDAPTLSRNNDDTNDDDDKQEFSFEEPVIDGNNQSIEEEEKSLINALRFKKNIAPLD